MMRSSCCSRTELTFVIPSYNKYNINKDPQRKNTEVLLPIQTKCYFVYKRY